MKKEKDMPIAKGIDHQTKTVLKALPGRDARGGAPSMVDVKNGRIIRVDPCTMIGSMIPKQFIRGV